MYVDNMKSKQQVCHNWRKATVREYPTMFTANDNMMATLSSRTRCAGSSCKQRAAPHF